MTDKLDLETIYEAVAYDFSTGNLIWKERPQIHFSSYHAWKTANARSFGQIAGYKNPFGYIEIRIFGKMYKAHRVA